jgi:multiple sugar transport system permease protein
MVFFRTIYFTPVVTSTVAWAIVMSFILQNKSGTINQFLNLFGIHGPNWLYDPNWAMAAIIFTRSFKNVGMNMIIFLAALQGLPREHVEAAMVDGATTLQSVRYIIIPYLAPTILLVLIITVISVLNMFDYILLMTQGGPGNATMVIAYYVFYSAFKENEFGYASAVAVVQFVIGVVLTGIQWSLRQRANEV